MKQNNIYVLAVVNTVENKSGPADYRSQAEGKTRVKMMCLCPAGAYSKG